MRIEWMRANVQCDGCGNHFVVRVDTGRTIPPGWDLPQIVVEEIRNGDMAVHAPSYQADMALCTTCTKVADGIGDDDEYQPTREEILRAIAKPE